MSKLAELIAELCPDGVEYKKLESMGKFTRGKRFVRSDVVDSGIPAIHYGDIYTSYGIWADTAHININETLAGKMRFAKKNDVIVVGAGENDMDIGIAVAWLGEEKVAIHDACYIFEHSMDSKYISYYMRSNMYHLQIKKYVSTGKICAISAKGIGQALIPVPPLEVQREIVRILDSFTELTSELTSELTARKKQYEYYRDFLLTFGDEVEWKTLGEVGDVTKLAGFEFTEHVKYSDEGTIIALRGLNIKNGQLELSQVKYIDDSNFAKLSRSKLQINDMMFTYVGTVGQVALIDKNDKYYLAPNVARIRFQEKKVNPAFMKYYFQTNKFIDKQINRYMESSSMKNLTMENIRKFSIPIPPLNEQVRIVKILDHFDILCNDISTGLPAEIEARQKQYEYYRDKLLTFKELS